MGYFVSQYGGDAKKIVDAINLIENQKIKTVLLKLLELLTGKELVNLLILIFIFPI